MSGFKVTRKQRQGGLFGMAKRVRDLNDAVVTVGFQGISGSARHESGATIAEIAAWNEFGTKTIPERGFFRRTLKESGDKIRGHMQKEIWNVVDGGQTVTRALGRVGVFAAAEVVKTIDDSKSWATPNAPSTVRQKSTSSGTGDQPLVDSGRMLNSVTYVARKDGAVVEQGGGR